MNRRLDYSSDSDSSSDDNTEQNTTHTDMSEMDLLPTITLTIMIRGVNLDGFPLDENSEINPYFVLRSIDNRDLYVSESVEEDINPVWNTATVSVNDLADGDIYQDFQIVVIDSVSQDIIGSVFSSVYRLEDTYKSGESLVIRDERKRQSGEIVVQAILITTEEPDPTEPVEIVQEFEEAEKIDPIPESLVEPHPESQPESLDQTPQVTDTISNNMMGKSKHTESRSPVKQSEQIDQEKQLPANDEYNEEDQESEDKLQQHEGVIPSNNEVVLNRPEPLESAPVNTTVEQDSPPPQQQFDIAKRNEPVNNNQLETPILDTEVSKSTPSNDQNVEASFEPHDQLPRKDSIESSDSESNSGENTPSEALFTDYTSQAKSKSEVVQAVVGTLDISVLSNDEKDQLRQIICSEVSVNLLYHKIPILSQDSITGLATIAKDIIYLRGDSHDENEFGENLRVIISFCDRFSAHIEIDKSVRQLSGGIGEITQILLTAGYGSSVQPKTSKSVCGILKVYVTKVDELGNNVTLEDYAVLYYDAKDTLCLVNIVDNEGLFQTVVRFFPSIGAFVDHLSQQQHLNKSFEIKSFAPIRRRRNMLVPYYMKFSVAVPDADNNLKGTVDDKTLNQLQRRIDGLEAQPNHEDTIQALMEKMHTIDSTGPLLEQQNTLLENQSNLIATLTNRLGKVETVTNEISSEEHVLEDKCDTIESQIQALQTDLAELKYIVPNRIDLANAVESLRQELSEGHKHELDILRDQNREDSLNKNRAVDELTERIHSLDSGVKDNAQRIDDTIDRIGKVEEGLLTKIEEEQAGNKDRMSQMEQSLSHLHQEMKDSYKTALDNIEHLEQKLENADIYITQLQAQSQEMSIKYDDRFTEMQHIITSLETKELERIELWKTKEEELIEKFSKIAEDMSIKFEHEFEKMQEHFNQKHSEYSDKFLELLVKQKYVDMKDLSTTERRDHFLRYSNKYTVEKLLETPDEHLEVQKKQIKKESLQSMVDSQNISMSSILSPVSVTSTPLTNSFRASAKSILDPADEAPGSFQNSFLLSSPELTPRKKKSNISEFGTPLTPFSDSKHKSYFADPRAPGIGNGLNRTEELSVRGLASPSFISYGSPYQASPSQTRYSDTSRMDDEVRVVSVPPSPLRKYANQYHSKLYNDSFTTKSSYWPPL
jgi:hypothetical protein